MSVIRELIEIFTTRNKHLSRIADALERIAPVPEDPGPELTPSEAVSYVDEEKIAKIEMAEEIGEMERFTKAQEELDARDDGGIGVLGSSDRS